MNSAVTNQKNILNNLREQYDLAVIAYYGYKGDRTDDTGTALLDRMIETRDAMINAALEYANYSQYAAMKGAYIMNTLRERVKKSPTARNLFIDEIMTWELD